jgi:hypothetical protein
VVCRNKRKGVRGETWGQGVRQKNGVNLCCVFEMIELINNEDQFPTKMLTETQMSVSRNNPSVQEVVDF